MVTPPPPHWQLPLLASRTGAAHQRRGVPCQDACGWQGLRDGAADPVQVLVVSDGHGGSRYRRSEVGSRLACAVALREVARALAAAATGQPRGAIAGQGGWADWLAQELPERIAAGWRQEVEAHGRAHPDPDGVADGGVADGKADSGAAVSPLLYGATLGVLVLTPHWWGHTGLGDWDLVHLGADGQAMLLSEELDDLAVAEATHSLCMPRAERWFAPRSGLHPLTAAQPAFQLLLCTDGIRKSCGTDADFLTLAGHLAELPAAPRPGENPDLDRALDLITREGSGDDVSAVIVRWDAEVGDGAAPQTPLLGGPLLLQPEPPSAPLPPGPDSSAAAPVSTPSAEATAPFTAAPTAPTPTTTPDGPLIPAAAPAAAAARSAPPAPIPAFGPAAFEAAAQGPGAGRPGVPVGLGAASVVLGLAGAAVAGAALAAWWWKLGPFAPADPPALLSAQQLAAVQRQVLELCDGPGAAGLTVRDPAASAPAALGKTAAGRDPQASAESGPGGSGLPASARLESGRLERIRSTLNQRLALFTRLAVAPPEQLRAELASDPLTALIALSRLAPDRLVVRGEPGASPLGPTSAGSPRSAAGPSGGGPSGRTPSAGNPAAGRLSGVLPPGTPPLAVCAELRQELQGRWARLAPEPAPSPSPRLRPSATESATPPPPPPLPPAGAPSADGRHNR